MSFIRYTLDANFSTSSSEIASSSVGAPLFSFANDRLGQYAVRQTQGPFGPMDVYVSDGMLDVLEGSLHTAGGDDLLSPQSGGFYFNFSDNRGGVDIESGNYRDILRGGSGNDTLQGGGGDDLLEGGLGQNVIDGGSGVNTVSYQHFDIGTGLGVSVDLSGGLALDALYQGTFVEQLSNVQNILGSAFTDILTGDAGINVIEGGAGADILNGGDGIDTVTYAHSKSGVVVDLSNLGPQTGGAPSDATSDYLWNFENVIGSKYADSITGDSDSNALNGSAGNDTLTGLGGNDRYYASAGDVIVEELDGGRDSVVATGDFTLPDNVEDLYAHDRSGHIGVALTGNSLDNRIFGGGGADTLTGLGGNDRYYVGAGDTVVEAAGGGIDTVYASVSFSLSDNVENLIVHGKGSFALNGNDLANVIKGGSGDDTIDGGGGRDKLYGAGGRDVFVFHDASAALGTVKDFVSGDDLIDLSAIQAQSGAAMDQAFNWIGDSPFSGSAGELHQRFAGNSTIVEGDVNGDGRADFRLVLAGHLELSADDFML